MNLSTQPYKGTRDFYPEDFKKRQTMFDRLRSIVKKYGYEEYDAPLIEPMDLYRAKTGDEIVNEQTYAFVDRGGREVVIRPEMTPSVSRMVASKRHELNFPLRWFSIPNLWRYERPQKGRLREHWQLNVDIFGDEKITAEHELILLGHDILRDFGAKDSMYEIRINNRKFINFLMKDYLGLDDNRSQALCRLIDRMHKINPQDFKSEVFEICSEDQRQAGLPEMIVGLMMNKKASKLPPEIIDHESFLEIQSLLNMLSQTGVTNAVFDMSLMRGFDYYTGIVFEFFDNNPENNRSMFGGGRYDGLVGMFGVESVPVAGFGMGDVTLSNFLITHKLNIETIPDIDLVVITIGDVYNQAQKLLSEMRDMGLNVFVDYTNRKLATRIKSADRRGAKYVMFIGENEISEGRYPVKNLSTGQEEKHSPERLVSIIKDFRKI